LQFCGDTTLLGKIAGIEPGTAQFLDARAVGPAVISGLAVGPQRRVAERVDVRDRAFQPPLSGGDWLVRRLTTAPNSISCRSTLRPARRSWSAPTRLSARIPASSVGAMTTIGSPS
jgi:hypothetical protein